MKHSPPLSAASRQRKQAVWPDIARLAADGLSCRKIAAKLAIPRTTVTRWLRAIRRESTTRQAPDPAETIRKKIEHYRLIAEKLLEALRLSQTDKQVRLVEKSGPADDPAAKQKHSIRTETRSGNASYLAKAMDAENKIDALEQRLAALERTEARDPAGRSLSLANLTDDDLENLALDDLENFSDDQLFVIECRLRAKYERNGLTIERPLLTNEDLRDMNDEELTALEMLLQDEIDALDDEAPPPEPEDDTRP